MMSNNPYSQFTGVPMSSDDIETLLESEGYGILSLARDDEPYSIPISFGYDGESIYLGLLELDQDPTKIAFIGDGATARLLVTDISHRFDWRSIAVAGPLRSIDKGTEQWEDLLDTLEDNAWFMPAFERSGAIESIQGWELEIDELTGLEQKEESYE
jgi:nitroimidazol reductase NimA-like FMN-containing flavoprotein (pyridoxamine 5'-phosphate oxidase superfamily)